MLNKLRHFNNFLNWNSYEVLSTKVSSLCHMIDGERSQRIYIYNFFFGL